MMRPLLFSLVLLSACDVASAPEAAEADTSPVKVDLGGGFNPPGNTVTNVTITGRVFFDDWRDYGRFDLRKTKLGAVGAHHSMDGSSTNSNYLALRDAKVSVYEVDKNYLAESDCVASTFVGSTVVGMDGSWTINLPTIFDGCGTDDDLVNKVKLDVKVTLEFCDDKRCFSVVDPNSSAVDTLMTPWSESFAGAGSGTSLSIGSNGNATLADLQFEDTTTLQDTSDVRAEAAIIFAGLVDVTRKFHVSNTWPGHVADYGEVILQFPTGDATGVTSGTSSIKMILNQTKAGWTAIHEYGHILDNRVTSFSDNGWGPNDLTPCGNDFSKATTAAGYVLDTATECDSWSRVGEKEYKAKAYSEGFADFVVHVTLEGLDSVDAPAELLLGCDAVPYDDNDSLTGIVLSSAADGFARRRIFGCTLGTGCTDGAAYPTNVARALCDWYDDNDDDDIQLSGPGDTLSHTLVSVHDAIEAAYLDKGASAVSSSGLTICDVVSTHLASVSNDQAHLDLISNNGFDCD